MLGRVAWRAKSAQTQSAKVDLITIVQSLIGCLELGGTRRKEGCPLDRQLAATRDEIRVEVGLDGQVHQQAEPLSDPEIRRRVTAGIDHQSRASPQRYDIGLVS